MEPGDYCRHVETYLCKKNDGHLIRIVGPAFERVCGWATRGVPLKIALRGIDRYFERYYAKGPRRWPVRIEFCENDVLDLFDDWHRAVGVSGAVTGTGVPETAETKHRTAGLPTHLDRVVARLTALRGGPGIDAMLDALVDRMIRELDAARDGARRLRGGARDRLLKHLNDLDRELLQVARSTCDARALDVLRRDAEAELEPFRARMPAQTFDQSIEACVDRLVRERFNLPMVSFE